MQGIYTNIPETNHVPKQYNVAAILSLLFIVPISLAAALALMYFYIRTFRSMCAVPNMAVFCSSFYYYYYYYYYYYLTAIGLTHGGSSVHLHTHSTQNTEDGTHNNYKEKIGK
jgi:hypothetical protein